MRVHLLAKEASKYAPVDGLMFLERAQNSAIFTELQIRKLRDVEKSMFSL